jgi:Tfp pilus assembly protein PilN
MINLLPPQNVTAIRYGRQNSTLRIWLIGGFISIIGLVIILAGGWLYLDHQSKGFQTTINNSNNQLKLQNIDKVRAESKEITGDISVIDKILSQEVHFSDLIQSIGSYMPPGTVLGTLSLSDKVTGTLDLSASAKDYASAAQIAVNLSDPKDNLFSKVDIVNVGCSSNPDQVYKCSATFRALFSKSAQDKFLGLPAGTSK